MSKNAETWLADVSVFPFGLISRLSSMREGWRAAYLIPRPIPNLEL